MILSLVLSLFLQASFAQPPSTQCSEKYDQLDIPHVQVSSEPEFYYCFGYLHGKDRAWQMDFFRRVVEGRNAEVLGFEHMKTDLMMRLVGLADHAKRIWSEVPADKKMFLEAYAAGANDGFKIGKGAREFQDAGYEPEPWKPEHTIAVLLLQSFDQTRRTFVTDYDEEKFKETWGDKAQALFDEDQVPWLNTILKEGEYHKKEAKTSLTSPRPATEKIKLWHPFPSVFGEESGSNNWVVSAQKSKTKNAIFANDPHLDLKTPLFWYWVNLKSQDMKVLGASVPGVPVIASGTNGKVAWGLTNSYFNTGDVAFVKDIPKEEIESLRPVVWIKFWFFKLPFFFKSFERTKYGHPVLPLELEKKDPLYLRWSGYSLTAQDILPMFSILKSQTVSDANDVLRQIGLPSWNFVFADSEGKIGYRAIGKLLRVENKTAYGLPTLTYEELKNPKFLSDEEKPQVLNPSRQYVYSANNRHWPADAKFYGGRGYSQSFRGLRIDELLKVGPHDVESFKAIQCDRQAVDARFFVPLLLRYFNSEVLAAWEYQTEDHSASVGVYRRLMDILMSEWKVNEYALYKLLQNLPADKIKEIKKFHDQAVVDVKGRAWGEMHRLLFPHLSRNANWVYSPDIAGVGDAHSVDPGTAKWNDDKRIYEQGSGASMRVIIELAQTPRIQLVLPGLNRDYTVKSEKNPWQDWKDCRYSEVEF